MAAIGRWLATFLLGWALDQFRAYLLKRTERKKEMEKIAEDNREAIRKLEEAKSEQERIDAGSQHLKR